MRSFKFLLCYCCILLVPFAVTAQDKKESTPPKIVDLPRPDYPQAAKDAGVGGEVFVLLLIDKKGLAKVVDAYGPMAPCSALDDPLTQFVQRSAVEAAKKATFTPATYCGKPVEKGLQVTYVFDPNEGRPPRGEPIGTTRSEPQANWPVTLKIPKAHYPGASGELAGLVKIKVLIDEQGHVVRAGALSGYRKLRTAAVDAACRFTFQPATRNGKPIMFEYVFEYNFYNVFIRE